MPETIITLKGAMTTCVINYYDEPNEHELNAVDYQCSALCMFGTLADCGIKTNEPSGTVNVPDAEDVEGGAGSIGWGECPGGAETQSDVHCSGPGCGELLWRGLSFYEDLADQQRRAEGIVRDTEHLHDLAAGGDADALEVAFREALLPDWPGHKGINPNTIDYDALVQRFVRNS